MKVVVTGATGNVGTSVLAAPAQDSGVREIVGLSRRPPAAPMDKTTWVAADVVDARALTALFTGADAVVHLAWLIQPSRDESTLRRANVEGSARVFDAVAAAGVPVLADASSVAGLSTPQDGAWTRLATGGIDSSYYSAPEGRGRAAPRPVRESPARRVVRMRPGLIFKRDAATEIRRYFAGPFLPNALLRHGLLPVLPGTDDLVFQAVHSHDVGEAFRLALAEQSARGAYNLAAEPVLDSARLASVRAPGRSRSRRGCCAGGQTTWKARCSPRRRAGWTWRSRFR